MIIKGNDITGLSLKERLHLSNPNQIVFGMPGSGDKLYQLVQINEILTSDIDNYQVVLIDSQGSRACYLGDYEDKVVIRVTADTPIQELIQNTLASKAKYIILCCRDEDAHETVPMCARAVLYLMRRNRDLVKRTFVFMDFEYVGPSSHDVLALWSESNHLGGVMSGIVRNPEDLIYYPDLKRLILSCQCYVLCGLGPSFTSNVVSLLKLPKDVFSCNYMDPGEGVVVWLAHNKLRYHKMRFRAEVDSLLQTKKGR